MTTALWDDDLDALSDTCGCPSGEYHCPYLAAHLKRAKKDVERLRAALERFGQHAGTCGSRRWWKRGSRCTCGLVAAILGEKDL